MKIDTAKIKSEIEEHEKTIIRETELLGSKVELLGLLEKALPLLEQLYPEQANLGKSEVNFKKSVTKMKILTVLKPEQQPLSIIKNTRLIESQLKTEDFHPVADNDNALERTIKETKEKISSWQKLCIWLNAKENNKQIAYFTAYKELDPIKPPVLDEYFKKLIHKKYIEELSYDSFCILEFIPGHEKCDEIKRTAI